MRVAFNAAFVALLIAFLAQAPAVAEEETKTDKALTLLVLGAPLGEPSPKVYGLYMHGETTPTDGAVLEEKLRAYAKAKDEAKGFPGTDAKTEFSQNLLAIRADARCPAEWVPLLLSYAQESRLSRVAVAATQDFDAADYEIAQASPAQPKRMRVFDEVTKAYRRIDLPTTVSVPKLELMIALYYDAAKDRGTFELSDGIARQEEVADLSFTMAELCLGVKATPQQLQERIQKRLKLADAIKKRLDANKLTAACIKPSAKRSARSEAPFGLMLAALDACNTVKGAKVAEGKAALEVKWRWTPVPPAPEVKPEEKVEYPKDEPPAEDPTKDEKIVEDAKDEHNEDPKNPGGDLEDPPEGARYETAKAFAHRIPRGGGGRPHDDRMRAALDWLNDHQNAKGHWSANKFSDDTRRKNARRTFNLEFVSPGDPKGDKGWEETSDVGVTGLALMAFCGAGYSHREGDYKDACRNAAIYLRKIQGNDGCFGAKEDDHFVYNHAMAAIGIIELYGLTGDAALKPTAEKAVKFVLDAQNPGLGWRYGVKPGINDTSVTGWMIQALFSAQLAGLEVKTETPYKDAAKWLDTVTANVQGFPKTGYNQPGSNNARLRSAQEYDHNPAMDALNIYSRRMMNSEGWDLNNRDLKAMANLCVEQAYLPAWDHHKIDYYYWYYASYALYQVGGSYWSKWEKALSKTLLNNQRGFRPEDKGSTKDTLDEHGSWDSVDAWGSAGGRVYATALNCLTLQVYYRHLKPAAGKTMATAHEK